MPKNCSKTRDREGGAGGRAGFTFIEVMIALAILAITAMALMGRRTQIVRDAVTTRDARMVWVLAAQKMAELELDEDLWAGDGGSQYGDFYDLGPEYGDFSWEYEATLIEVPTNDPDNPQEKPKEIFHLVLTVYARGNPEPYVLESRLPLRRANPGTIESGEATTTPPPPTSSSGRPGGASGRRGGR